MNDMKRSNLPDNAGAARGGHGAVPAGRLALPQLGRGGSDETPVVSFVSLGCAKNLVDSEKMLGDLAGSGCLISGDEDAADTVVVNTCGFLESSRDEALDIL